MQKVAFKIATKIGAFKIFTFLLSLCFKKHDRNILGFYKNFVAYQYNILEFTGYSIVKMKKFIQKKTKSYSKGLLVQI